MIIPSDKEYIATKKIVQGKASMPEEFIPLANYIDSTFNVKTLNIIRDTINNGQTERLRVCLETDAEEKIFHVNGLLTNYDPDKQRLIAQKYGQIRKKEPKPSFITSLFKHRKKPVFICFSAFKRVALIEAGDKVTKSEIDNLKLKLGDNNLWEISRMGAHVTFFLYTDEQVKQYEKFAVRKEWKNKYFDLLEPHDEFGYLSRDTFEIRLDSKENFDNNFQSNWYYYYH